jgi:hypothetical protein
LVSVDVSSSGYAPAVGDPFTGSYTFNADQIGTVSGEFFESGLAADVADLEVHALTCAFPSANVPLALEPTPSFTIIATPTTYNVTISAYAVTPEFSTSVLGMSFSWTLSNPNSTAPPTTALSTVPPDLSTWTQASDAVSIQLF